MSVFKNPECLTPLLPELVQESGLKLFDFGYALGRLDKKQVLLRQIQQAQIQAGESGTSPFFSGYSSSLFETDQAAWEAVMAGIFADDALIHLVGGMVMWNSSQRCHP